MSDYPDVPLDVPYGVLGPVPSLLFNVFEYGAVGDGVTDDTAAILEVLDAVPDGGGRVELPAGYTFVFSANLPIKSATRVFGGGTLKAAPLASWSGTPYYGLTNVNNTATDITDHDIEIVDITIDYTDLPSADGTRHCIYIQAAERVRVVGVTVLGGSSAVALVSCHNTLELGNSLIGFTNCGSDHWYGTATCGMKNARVVACHIETTVSAQMLNWNPDGTLVTSAGYLAENLTVTGCTFVSTENPSTPIQIEPLRTNGQVRGVTFTGNILKGCYLVMRGDVSGATITGNEFSDFSGTVEAITGYTRNGGTPANVEIVGNVIRDPLTSVGNLGVIRMESNTATIACNRISGTGYGCAGIYVGSTTAQIFGNQVDTTPTVAYLQTGMRVPNGSTNYYAWTDNGGGIPRMYVQSSDNNFIFHGTSSTGTQRTIWGVIMRSDTSEFTVAVPQINTSTWRSTPAAAVSAAGTVIGTATVLTSNFNNVTSCTAGVADGVALTSSVGRPQTVTNSTAATLKVYPNNSGSSQIDAGGVGVAVTILAGKSKTFLAYTATDFRTIGEF